MNKYDNGVTKRLCRDCSFCKRRFNDSWCKIYQDNKGEVLGIYEWFDTPHPKCPLKNITYKKLLGIAHRFRYKDGWAYYQAKALGIDIPKEL